MISSISDQLHGGFPFDVFRKEYAESFQRLSTYHSVPADYFGTAALFTISSLAGGMYTVEKLRTKIILYAMLVGDSGAGKTPAYNLLCGDHIMPLERLNNDAYQVQLKAWQSARAASRKAEAPFSEPKPVRRIRMAQGGTAEAIMHKAAISLAGFGLYYDEGGRMMGSPNAYKKESNSTDFWNEVWNGHHFNDLRVDDELERFVPGTCISVLVGMQTDRVHRYLTKDAIDSGLAGRFLITSHDGMELNENTDPFNDDYEVCEEWRIFITGLYRKGSSDFFKDEPPCVIKLTPDAKLLYTAIQNKLKKDTNKRRTFKREADVSQMMDTYDTKLFTYFKRFMPILAIANCGCGKDIPIITEREVMDAEKLYNYYRKQAERLFSRLNSQDLTDLTDSEQRLFDLLPVAFTTEDIKRISDTLKLSDGFFRMCFMRKYSKGWIKRVDRGHYEKLV